ncbi:hypothetical protein C8A00DRAFT_14345 [Chaetomidium leptoderma]|uniref:Uncharacterized protein n=1 Tax=Chaetomidium leptoderma TaxID=669021 RepID=A0AAN6VMW3_9PEZI|nr:hypothetical protein C8A00DRAFT_14345 [Chaetomidium leptoderma]
MSPVGSIYNNLMAPKPQPPPYNKVAKLVMKVEVETVQLRSKEGEPAIRPGKKYPYYPLLNRTVETVGGDGSSSGSSSPASPPSSPSSSTRRSSSSSSSKSPTSSPGVPVPVPSPTASTASSGLSYDSYSPSSPLSRSSDSEAENETELRIVGIIHEDGEVTMLEGVDVGDSTTSGSSSSSSSSQASLLRSLGITSNGSGPMQIPAGTKVIYAGGPSYRGWTRKKNKFTRRETDRPNYRALRLAEAEAEQQQNE